MRYLLYLFLSAIFIFCNTRIHATHLVGGDLSYQNVGPNKFDFYLTLYRDCAGEPMQQTEKISYHSILCNLQGTFNVKLISKSEISPVCTGVPTTCQGGSQPGIEKYVYKGTITMKAQCKDWVFYLQKAYRNTAITNLLDPATQMLYVEATLNNVDAPANNSPVFNNAPVSFLCMGQTNQINPGTIEADQDVLKYSSIAPRTTEFVQVKYKAPFDASNPVSNSAFSINPSSGDLKMNPSADGEISVTTLKVEEYRNGVLVGSVIRDIQIRVINCSNNNPVLGGINNPTNPDADSIIVCAGQIACFGIVGKDADAGQKLTMSWNKGLDTNRTTVEFLGTATNPKMNLCWQTKDTDAGVYYFTVTLKDNACPFVGSVTKAYKVRVNPLPVVQVPPLQNVGCNSKATVYANVTKGVPPFFYKWSTGETTPSILVDAGVYDVIVTDSRGCAGTNTAYVNGGIDADFSWVNKTCLGEQIDFTDESVTHVGNIVSWAWDFDDPQSGINNQPHVQNPVHTFTKAGKYKVKLFVQDDQGCLGTSVKEVNVCALPKADFIWNDTCKYNVLPYFDLSDSKNCGITKYAFDFGDGRTYQKNFDPDIPPGLYYPGAYYLTTDDLPPDTGFFDITLTIVNELGCENSITKTIHINENPWVTIQEDNLFLDCSNPDTTLHAIYKTDDGKAPFTLAWSTGSTADTTVINAIGEYTVTITDANGCDSTAIIKVYDPLKPDFYGTAYCTRGQTVNFFDISFSAWGIAKWEWDFGDGTPKFITTNPLVHPSHKYNIDSVYTVTLIVTDAKGCIDTVSKQFIAEIPDNHFLVTPSTICLGQELNIESFRGRFIDSLKWDFGNSHIETYVHPKHDKPKGTHKLLQALETDSGIYYTYDGDYTYPSGSGNTFTVKLMMWYDSLCYRDTTASISIFPELKVDIDTVINVCAQDSIYFKASQKNISGPGNMINSWSWKFYHQEHEPPFENVLIDSSDLQNPVMKFDEHGNYYASLKVSNSDGCEVLIDNYGFNVINLPTPVFCVYDQCADKQMQFFYFCSIFPEIEIDSIRWDFEDGFTTNAINPFHVFPDSGVYNVKTTIMNSSFGCKADTTIPIRIFLPPVSDFKTAEVCIGDSMMLSDLSYPSPGEHIKTWMWSFGDNTGYTVSDSLLKDATHLYADTGTFQVKLIVQSDSSACYDTITKPVIVHGRPKAGFTFDVNELTAKKPIKFTDESMGGEKWLWHFGDGDSVLITDPQNTDPQHTYSGAIRNIEIRQIVYNEFECTDTAKHEIDLHIHLLLPNAFSPNGDNNNDQLNLIYKGIKKLDEFRIYNRWGELVYESTSLNDGWDGRYQGKEQPIGVYVYYIKATTFEEEEIRLSGKLTLIR